MRKFLIFMILLISVFSLSAASSSPLALGAEYDGETIEYGANVAATNITLDLSGLFLANIWFESVAETPIQNDEIRLIPSTDGTAIGYVNLSWRVISSSPINLIFFAGGKLRSPGAAGEINWALYRTEDGVKKLTFDTSGDMSSEKIEIGIEEGKGSSSGSIPLVIRTSPYSSASYDYDYGAILKLNVRAD